jgi:TPR repeat protein
MIYWYKKSAKQGTPMAQNNLGVIYATGIGVDIDMSKAKYWIGKAKENSKTKIWPRRIGLNLSFGSIDI